MSNHTHTALSLALSRHYGRSQRWGFAWALWTAILWGAWYVPGTALWFEHPYVDIPADAQSLRLAATAVMTWVHAITVFLFIVPLLSRSVLGSFLLTDGGIVQQTYHLRRPSCEPYPSNFLSHKIGMVL